MSNQEIYQYTDKPILTTLPGEVALMSSVHIEPTLEIQQHSISFIGRLDEAFVAKGEATAENLWVGGVSLQKRLKNEPTLAAAVERDATPENINRFYVPSSPNAPTRCIDERCIEGYDVSKLLQERALGAQVPGGTPGAAFALRIVEGIPEDVRMGRRTIVDDLAKTINRFRDAGIFFGAHVDDHAHGENTGCGAIDKLPQVVARYTDANAYGVIHRASQAMLGKAYDEELFNMLYDRVTALNHNSDDYLTKQADGSYLYKQGLLKSMQDAVKKGKAVEKLSGNHNGVAVVINTVAGTTFDRDAFSVSTDHQVQVFNYDSWRTHELGRMMFPIKDDMTLQERYTQTRRALKFAHVRFAAAVATLMELTDGSLQIGVRS